MVGWHRVDDLEIHGSILGSHWVRLFRGTPSSSCFELAGRRTGYQPGFRKMVVLRFHYLQPICVVSFLGFQVMVIFLCLVSLVSFVWWFSIRKRPPWDFRGLGEKWIQAA